MGRGLLWPLVTILIGFGAVTGFGYLRPENVEMTMILAIAWAVISFIMVITGLHLAEVGRWVERIGVVSLIPGLVVLMMGAGAVGPASAVQKRSEVVDVRVTVVDPQSETRQTETGRETRYWVDYEFEYLDGRPVDGTITYRGDTNGYGLWVGQETKLFIDPEGELPIQMVEEIEPGKDAGLIGAGVVLLLIPWTVIVSVVRRRRRRSQWPAVS